MCIGKKEIVSLYYYDCDKMEDEAVEGKIILRGDKDIEVDALFDTGASRSVISKDLADKIKRFIELPEKEKYKMGVAKEGITIEIIGKCNTIANIVGCEAPVTTFEVTDGLPKGRDLIIGRPQLDEWGIQFTPEGPKPKKCPMVLELI